MPIDKEKFNTVATQGDIAGAVLQIRFVAFNLRLAIAALARAQGVDVDQFLTSSEDGEKQLGKMFNELVGWTE